MKRLLSFSLILVLATIFTSAFTHTTPADPFKKYSVTLTLDVQHYQAVLQSISSSDALSAKDANSISQQIITQLNPQIASDQKADSANKPKYPDNPSIESNKSPKKP
jgi:hypothetical protein